MRRIESSEETWSRLPAGADEAQQFDVEVLQLCKELNPDREHPDPQKLWLQAAETVKRRWGIERYQAMRDANSRLYSREARRRANGSTNDRHVSGGRAQRRRLWAGTD